jgi:LemA protein
MDSLGLGVVVLAFGGVVLAISYAIGAHNAVVKAARDCDEAWYGLDALLQQRHGVLAELVDTCPPSMTRERGLLTRVVELQASYDHAPTADDKVRTENELNRLVGQLHLGSPTDAAPKAGQSFATLQRRLSAVESSIDDAREYFNDGVTIHNTRIARFPVFLAARSLGYRERVSLEVPVDTRHDDVLELGDLPVPREEASLPPARPRAGRSGTTAVRAPGLSS